MMVFLKEPVYIRDETDRWNRRTFTIRTEYEVIEHNDKYITIESNEGILTSLKRKYFINEGW